VEAGFEYMIKRVTDVDLAVKHCRKTAVAVQAGGNVGLWPRRLAKYFSLVHTFEPVAHLYGALCHNTAYSEGVVVHNELLGAKVGGSVPFLVTPGGTSRVDPEGKVSLTTTTIDALALPACDAIFLDVEGFELQALAGARETIQKFRPVITVEIWEKNVRKYREWFALVGYELEKKTHGDYIFVPS
jgi:FkbM family methyltransferase